MAAQRSGRVLSAPVTAAEAVLSLGAPGQILAVDLRTLLSGREDFSVGVLPVSGMVDDCGLDRQEAARASRFRQVEARRRFVARRRWLRRVVAEVTGAEPGAVVSNYRCPLCTPSGGQSRTRQPSAAGTPGSRDHGRPAYLVNGVPAPVSLSVSTDGDWCVLVLSRDPRLRLGVDIADADSPAFKNSPAFEDTVLSPAERRKLGRLRPEERSRALARAWARKEAALKLSGEGLSVDPRTVAAEPAGPRAVLMDLNAASSPTPDGVPVPDRYVMALAVGYPADE